LKFSKFFATEGAEGLKTSSHPFGGLFGSTKIATKEKAYFFFLLFGACVKAEAATDLTVFDLLVRSNLLAFFATDFDVRSFFAIL
jgi:hypothetical protein